MLILDTDNTELLTNIHCTHSTHEKEKKLIVITAFKSHTATLPNAPHLKRRGLHRIQSDLRNPLCSAVLLRFLVPLRSAVPPSALPHPRFLYRPGLVCQPNLPYRPNLLSDEFVVLLIVHYTLPFSTSLF